MRRARRPTSPLRGVSKCRRHFGRGCLRRNVRTPPQNRFAVLTLPQGEGSPRAAPCTHLNPPPEIWRRAKARETRLASRAQPVDKPPIGRHSVMLPPATEPECSHSSPAPCSAALRRSPS